MSEQRVTTTEGMQDCIKSQPPRPTLCDLVLLRWVIDPGLRLAIRHGRARQDDGWWWCGGGSVCVR